MKVIDLGCGTGELTRIIFEALPDSEILGIDSSSNMLAESSKFACPGLKFKFQTIQEVSGNWDLIFSNAAIHWVNDHQRLIPKLLSLINPGGQIAVQIPSNHNHFSHKTVVKVAEESPFCDALDYWVRSLPVLEIDEYAKILYNFGCNEITVFEKVYPHVLKNVDDMVDWVSGTVLIPYFERLPKELHNAFLERYRHLLLIEYGSGEILYTYRRILLAATVETGDLK